MEAKVLSVLYDVEPDVIVLNKNWNQMRVYFQKGYYVSERREKDSILSKDSRILVRLLTEEGKEFEVDFKKALQKIYGKDLNGIQLVERLKNQLQQGKIAFVKESRGRYWIKEK